MSVFCFKGTVNEEFRPLLHKGNMEETKIGISHQTLVSNSGQAAKFPQYLAALIGKEFYM